MGDPIKCGREHGQEKGCQDGVCFIGVETEGRGDEGVQEGGSIDIMVQAPLPHQVVKRPIRIESGLLM